MKVEQKLIRVKGCHADNFDYLDENLLNVVQNLKHTLKKDLSLNKFQLQVQDL